MIFLVASDSDALLKKSFKDAVATLVVISLSSGSYMWSQRYVMRHRQLYGFKEYNEPPPALRCSYISECTTTDVLWSVHKNLSFKEMLSTAICDYSLYDMECLF